MGNSKFVISLGRTGKYNLYNEDEELIGENMNSNELKIAIKKLKTK